MFVSITIDEKSETARKAQPLFCSCLAIRRAGLSSLTNADKDQTNTDA